MLKRLKKYLTTLGFYRSEKHHSIPFEFEDSEKIVRSIFSPINISKDGTKLKANAFKSPTGIDEISVNRLFYTSLNFCKNISKEIQNPSGNRSYFGLALLYKEEIDQCNCDIYYTPNEDNAFHADIKIGYIPKRGEPLPSEFQFKVKELTAKSRLFKDTNPNSSNWDGGVVE